MTVGTEKGEHHSRNVIIQSINAGIVYGIYMPIIIYYLYKFYRLRHAPYLKNRYPILTIITNIANLGILFFGTWNGFLYINSFGHVVLSIILLFILASSSVWSHSIVLRIWYVSIIYVHHMYTLLMPHHLIN